MKFKFKIQPYQTDAVENTVAVFSGQPFFDNEFYRRDLGKREKDKYELEGEDTGFRNHEIEISSEQLLANIRTIQAGCEIIPSENLVSDLGKVMLDIEMETGTGKTYVYIKTMFELNKRYGWSKFIVVVPSIAIREGVAKSFGMLEDHFMEHYGKKARYFIYNSNHLSDIDSFSDNSKLNVMIINTQAFAASLKEGGRSKESRIIYTERDNFASRRPIDVISANHPIIIMDEPQKMEGAATKTALKNFKPLFVLNYSATHRTRHNTIYALDALDAFKQKLVKKIYVKGFEVKNLQGTGRYLYIDNILLSPKRPPQVKIELEVKLQSGEIRRKSKVFDVGDNLYHESGLHQYDGFVISEINPYNNSVTFMNGEVIKKGEVVGDVTEEMMKRVQIRETIASHFEKEQQLFERGIKTLSLFFIDEVAKYKSYDDEGNEVKGVFQKIFEEEYIQILNEKISLFSNAYQQYLRRFEVSKIHNGYFSIDKKTGRSVNSETGRKSDISDDISAYDLILTMIVEHISYNMIEGKYESSIFTQTKRADLNKAYPAHKHITDYVFTDGLSEKSTERKFAEQLDAAEEVAVYAKLPRTFKIPTPVGNYSPDWAIAFKRGTVKHIFFIAETKGSMESMELRAVEKAKIDCAKKLFNELSTSQVRYHEVDSYANLLDIIKNLD